MSKINALLRVLNQKVKTRFFMDFQFMDCLNMTAYDHIATFFWHCHCSFNSSYGQGYFIVNELSFVSWYIYFSWNQGIP